MAKGGEVIEPYAAPHLLAPGSIVRPNHVTEDDWQRMGWHARWKATRPLVTEPAWLTAAHCNQDNLRLRLALSRSSHVRHPAAS